MTCDHIVAVIVASAMFLAAGAAGFQEWLERKYGLRKEEELQPVIHGRWITIPNHRDWDQKQCSVCGDIRCCQGNYCPNCGAKMDEDDDD